MQRSPPHFETSDRITRLEVTVYGLDGTNGLRGTLRQQDKRVTKIERHQERQQTEWTTTVRIVRWGAVIGLFLFGMFGPAPLVERFFRAIQYAQSAGL